MLLGASAGCSFERNIEVDLSADRPRFLLHGQTWGWPFVWPRVNALAIGYEDQSVWEIESVDPSGVPASQLAIIFGEVPEGFRQQHPPNDARPQRLLAGRTYFVGATGPNDEVFRTVFAVPVSPLGTPPDPEFTPDRQRMTPEPAGRTPTKPAD